MTTENKIISSIKKINEKINNILKQDCFIDTYSMYTLKDTQIEAITKKSFIDNDNHSIPIYDQDPTDKTVINRIYKIPAYHYCKK